MYIYSIFTVYFRVNLKFRLGLTCQRFYCLDIIGYALKGKQNFSFSIICHRTILILYPSLNDSPLLFVGRTLKNRKNCICIDFFLVFFFSLEIVQYLDAILWFFLRISSMCVGLRAIAFHKLNTQRRNRRYLNIILWHKNHD